MGLHQTQFFSAAKETINDIKHTLGIDLKKFIKIHPVEGSCPTPMVEPKIFYGCVDV